MFLSPKISQTVRIVLCAGLALAASACVAPRYTVGPPGYQSSAHRPLRARPRAPAPIPQCAPASRPTLSEAEKSRLFNDFDSWKEQRSGPTTASAPVPPPAPDRRRAAAPACREPRG